MRAGKHVLIEIPIADSVADSPEPLAKIAEETGVMAMGGHVRRFNPSHQWSPQADRRGELKIQQMDVQTYFFRRTNINAPASRAAGPITCCGITPATPSICSSTRPARRSPIATPCRGRGTRRSRSPWTWASS